MTPPATVIDGIHALCDLAEISAVAMVGSWARGSNQPDSDVDLIVLVENPARLLQQDDWYAAFGPDARLIRAEKFGALDERRLQLANGLVVEVGITTPSWAATDPLDPGTAAVVRDGMVPLFDPYGMLGRLATHAMM